ncbi:MAG: hypothetical protein ACK5LN_10820 [Propioniciclava sp.]
MTHPTARHSSSTEVDAITPHGDHQGSPQAPGIEPGGAPTNIEQAILRWRLLVALGYAIAVCGGFAAGLILMPQAATLTEQAWISFLPMASTCLVILAVLAAIARFYPPREHAPTQVTIPDGPAQHYRRSARLPTNLIALPFALIGLWCFTVTAVAWASGDSPRLTSIILVPAGIATLGIALFILISHTSPGGLWLTSTHLINTTHGLRVTVRYDEIIDVLALTDESRVVVAVGTLESLVQARQSSVLSRKATDEPVLAISTTGMPGGPQAIATDIARRTRSRAFYRMPTLRGNSEWLRV